MTRLLIILVPLVLAFWVFSIVDCALQPPIRHRGVPKAAWMLIVILIPIGGGVLWFLVGRVPASKLVVAAAPDDDPAFLGSLHSTSAQDERIRQLEEELARLDAEDELPPDPFSGEPRTDKPRTEQPRTDKPRPEQPRPDKSKPESPKRDGATTPTPPVGDNPPREGDDDGRGRHGTTN